MSPPISSIAQDFRRLASHVPARRRRQGVLILAFMFVGAIAELMTLGAVIPFLALISDSDSVQSYPQVTGLLSRIGWGDGRSLLVPAALLFIIVAIAAAAVRLTLAWVSQKFVYRVGFDLSTAMYERTLYRPYSYHVLHNTSEVVAGINKVQLVISAVMLQLMLGITAVIISVFIFLGLVAVDPVVALASAAGFSFIYLIVAISTRRRLRYNSGVIAACQTSRIQTVQEGLGAIRDVLIDQAQPIYLSKYRKLDSALRDAQAANQFIGAAPRFIVEAAGMVLIALLALLLSGRPGGIGGALPILGALALGAQRLLPLLQQIYNGWTQVIGNRQIMRDVLALLEYNGAQDIRTVSPPADVPFQQAIRLEGVCFRYGENAPPVLQDINLCIPRGARVGFIGKTGSGKSTIMDLIMGLLEPTEGSILVDGQRLDATRRAGWQAKIAHVPQSIYLSDASIKENIAFAVAREHIDMERVRAAARSANVASFIERLPEGYDTFVGEQGVRLSGGQRQRIGIARALYKRSTVLVFDEATSALDDATEAAVMDSIEGLGRELTVLMIAHRLSTVRGCDSIYRLANGRIEASGTFDEVVRLGTA